MQLAVLLADHWKISPAEVMHLPGWMVAAMADHLEAIRREMRRRR